MTPVTSMTTPYGAENLAAVPTPSAKPKVVPLVPPPARAVTTLVAMLTTRRLLLAVSATMTLEDPLTATPAGFLKAALVPMPLIMP